MGPLLEFIEIHLHYMQEPPTAPPRKRTRLAALKELRFDQTASTSGLLDHLILPKCTEMVLKGQFTGGGPDYYGYPTPQVHPSSITHLPVMREITKVAAMPNSCILSGPNGNLRFRCFDESREKFNAEFFTSFSPISTLDIRELWVGPGTGSYSGPWEQTGPEVRSAFEVLTKVEDLTLVSCKTGLFIATLGTAVESGVLLPGLRRLAIYVGCGDLDVAALVRCAKTRKEHSRPFREVNIVFKEVVTTDLIWGMESLRRSVGKVDHHVGVAPTLIWDGVQ